MAVGPIMGPRFRQAIAASFAATAPWTANTAYGPGVFVTNGGSTYVSPLGGVPSRATFTASDWTLSAAAGINAPLYVGTITGDGNTMTFTVTHNLGTANLVGQVHDPADSNAIVPGVDITFPTANTAQVVLTTALASGTALTVILH